MLATWHAQKEIKILKFNFSKNKKFVFVDRLHLVVLFGCCWWHLKKRTENRNWQLDFLSNRIVTRSLSLVCLSVCKQLPIRKHKQYKVRRSIFDRWISRKLVKLNQVFDKSESYILLLFEIMESSDLLVEQKIISIQNSKKVAKMQKCDLTFIWRVRYLKIPQL